MTSSNSSQIPLLDLPKENIDIITPKSKILPKYPWKINSELPKLDQHSQVKHAIIEEYIQRYIQTVMSPAHIPELKLSIIDGFCGGGCYQTDNGNIVDGSPILAMKAVKIARSDINHNRRNKRSVNVQYIFTDILTDTTDFLKFWLQAKLEKKEIDTEDFNKTEVIENDFIRELPAIIQKVRDWKGGERSIFILDQYCYKDVPMSAIHAILHHLKSSEIIFTFNVDNLITYLSEHAANKKAIENIGLDPYIPWGDLPKIKTEQQWRHTLQKYLAYGIKKESGARFMTLFFVKPQGTTSWGYWLIHLSNHYRAHEVMKTLHWEHATDFGHEMEPGIFTLGYRTDQDSDYTGQRSFMFDNDLKIACIEDLREFFGEKLFTIDKPTLVSELFQSCVSESTAAEIHLQEAVRQLHSSKNILITSKDGAIRKPSKTYRPDDIIEPSKQIGIFK